jgi:hypothetical protein
MLVISGTKGAGISNSTESIYYLCG